MVTDMRIITKTTTATWDRRLAQTPPANVRAMPVNKDDFLTG